MMIVDAQHQVVAQRLTRFVEHSGGRPDRLARLEDVLAALSDRKEADRLPSLCGQFAGSLDSDFALRLVPSGGESGNTVALLAAQQFVNRHTQHLALDVVQSDVDSGNCRLQHAPAFEVLTAIGLLPDPTDLHGIPADQELAIMLDGAGYRHLATAQAALSPTRNALVGLDLDQKLVPSPHPYRIGYDCSDPKLRGHASPHVASNHPASIDLQGHFSRT